MKYRNIILSAGLGLALIILSVSPVFSGNSFSDFFSQTKICFPHIAISDGWGTEIAVINPTAKTVSGTLTFFDKAGNQLGTAVPITLNVNGRYQATVETAFAGRGNIEYMIFTAPVFGLKGYTKFYDGQTRASIVASSPQTSGIFSKIEKNGWTGIAFVNTSDEDATVTLTAYNDAGTAVATAPMTVKAGEKKVKTATEFFAPQPITAATYIRFSSDQGIVGFFLNGTNNLTKLDGSKAL